MAYKESALAPYATSSWTGGSVYDAFQKDEKKDENQSDSQNNNQQSDNQAAPA
ncbi:hypothetical protein [Ileibacterium valens]|nr:hypothetical protein [Ileibacterium valens]